MSKGVRQFVDRESGVCSSRRRVRAHASSRNRNQGDCSKAKAQSAGTGTAIPSGFLVLAAFACCGLLVAGCTRTQYRQQADAVVSDAVAGAIQNPRFQLPGHNIAIDPRSRLYDPTDPDRPPMPPDDPDSHRLMECVDGHRGWPYWNKDGVLDDVEVNDYKASLPYDTDGKVRVDIQGAIELGRLHSRDYQAQLETLYLSALDVSAERFAFNCQYFGGNSTQYIGLGPLLGGGSHSDILTNTTNLQVNRMFTTGGTLVTGIANSIVWQFSGNRSTVNTGLVNFAVSQPLLQFAGRPRILERLTRAERNLLGNVRQFERYRQGFYLSLATGNFTSTGLQRAGGIFGGSGLTGFTGVGVGGFGGIGAISGFGGNIGAGSGIAPGGAGGYMGFLQNQQILQNTRARNSRLRDTWLQLTAAFDAGRLENRFQVDFARQSYYSGQSELLSALANYQTNLDQYKTQQLSLPPDVPLDLRDRFLEQFNLIDPELTRLQDDISNRLEVLTTAQVDGVAASDESPVVDCSKRVLGFSRELTKDLKRVEDGLPERRKSLADLARFPEVSDNQFDLRALTVGAMEERITVLRQEHGRVTAELESLANRVDELSRETELDPQELARAEREVLTRLSGSLVELSLLQARARLHGIAIIPTRLTAETAFQVALSQRADWMNAKAALVDSWRLIRYNANALRTNLTVNVSGGLENVSSTASNGVLTSGTDGQMRAGITIDPPLTRVLERNQFRQSLIDYQQSRRALMSARDQMNAGLRFRVRQIRLDQINLELRRLAVDVAITQTDVARLKLVEPEKPTTDGKPGTTSPTVARDLVDALGSLLITQQAFIFTWTDYEILRRLLDFDLGTMRLDEHGMWIDPGAMTDEMMLGRYYENCPDPLHPDEIGFPAGFGTGAPGELPPEPETL